MLFLRSQSLQMFCICVWEWIGAYFLFSHRILLGVFCRKRRCVGILPYSTTCWSLCRGSLVTSSCSKTICTACQKTRTTSKTLRVSAERQNGPYLLHWPQQPAFCFISTVRACAWKYFSQKIHASLTDQDKRQNGKMTPCEYQDLTPLFFSESLELIATAAEHSNAAIRKMVSGFQMNHGTTDQHHTPTGVKTSTAT